jgi:hypothetical protein
LSAGARRAAANLADLGRRVTDANSAVVDAILALPAKLDPLRAAALTALPSSDRARALPALARDIDRLFAAATNGAASQQRRVENMPAAPQASLPALLGPMRPCASGAAAASPRDRRSPAVLVLIAGYDGLRLLPGPAESEAFWPLGSRSKPHPPRARPLRP